MVAEVLSSSVGSSWAFRRAAWSSVDSTGSGSSLKNCFSSAATSTGRADVKQSSPWSSLACITQTMSTHTPLPMSCQTKPPQVKVPLKLKKRSDEAITHSESLQANNGPRLSEQTLCVCMLQKICASVHKKAGKIHLCYNKWMLKIHNRFKVGSILSTRLTDIKKCKKSTNIQSKKHRTNRNNSPWDNAIIK